MLRVFPSSVESLRKWRRSNKPSTAILVLLFCLVQVQARASDFSSADLEFFERRIRPVLSEKCYNCHSHSSTKLKAELFLDSREGLLKGGETSAAVVPGKPDESLLIKALKYQEQDLQMPPKGKLSDEQIADFVDWVKRGLSWPKESVKAAVAGENKFNLEQRMQSHWSWKPVHRPAVPLPRKTDWATSPWDAFILQKLESQNMSPAPSASKRTLARRLYLDLIGIPPSPEEIARFENNTHPNAYPQLVENLLASPHFGERWARHWMDLVRFAETLGHEFDFPRHNAWRYRDYLIRVLNQDVAYDQLVKEHVAGDLLPNPRKDLAHNRNESVIGTSFYWFGQQVHSPVDLQVNQSDIIDNQIDVLTKTFLGLTVSCARCHDHKFDAISTRDFYSLYGVISSSRYTQTAINQTPERRASWTRIESIKASLKRELVRLWEPQAEVLGKSLELAVSELGGSTLDRQKVPSITQNSAQIQALSKRWQASLTNGVIKLPELKKRLSSTETNPVLSVTATPPIKTSNSLSAMRDWTKWFKQGQDPLGATLGNIGFEVGAITNPVAAFYPPAALHSGSVSKRANGALRSPTFQIIHPYLHVCAYGRDSRFNVVINNFTMIQAPIYGGLRHVIDTTTPNWWVIDLSMWQGQRAYIEFIDAPHADPASGGKGTYGDHSYFAVVDVRESSTRDRPIEYALNWFSALVKQDEGSSETPKSIGAIFAQAFKKSLALWMDPKLATASQLNAAASLLHFCNQNNILASSLPSSKAEAFKKLIQQIEDEERQIVPLEYVPAMTDGNGIDETVFTRGNPRLKGESAQRGFLEAFHKVLPHSEKFTNGSGRLDLAECLVANQNPFTSRVMVNRVWQHLFGSGIVPTPDDFGVLGQPPSHPELLDWLADKFRSDLKWSIKSLIRMLVNSSTYTMASEHPNPQTKELDPLNRLWHRMPVRRLESESIRDSILAITGGLNTRMTGSSVETHLTPFMDGRGRPGSSGPIDGAGRRSIYLEVRNNFLPPMMRTFDTPIPFTTVGKRTASNVPAQALILMNDPFVKLQASSWAERIIKSGMNSADERIDHIFLNAYGRVPTPRERVGVHRFISDQKRHYSRDASESVRELELWSDVCHAIFNAKELIYIP